MSNENDQARPTRHGQAWDEGEEWRLYQAFAAGEAMPSVAAAHERSVGGIIAHLKIMGLLDEEGAAIEPRPDYLPTAAAVKRSEKAAAQAAGKMARKTAEPEGPTEINPRFAEALDVMMESDRSLFLTGKAGTGKSTLLKYFRRNSKKNVVVLAPTGIAALNVGGQTIHHFFRFQIDVTPQKVEAKRKIRNPRLYRKLQTVVIDEVSMVRADILDCVEIFLRMHGPHPGQPFGGVQMVFIGDLYQLPPVVGRQDREIFSDHYPTPYFFSAHALRHYDLPLIELEQVYRQKDLAFVALLNRVRDDSVTAADIALLNSRHRPTGIPAEQAFSIHLTATNRRADEINHTHLQALPGRSYGMQARVQGEFGREYFPAAPELSFKAGAQIMLLTNDREGRWVNGSIGVIESVQKDDAGREFVAVALQDHAEPVPVYPHKWEVYRFALMNEQIESEPVGTFEQYPFRLAWAVTIHKSQGKTFERVTIDIGGGAFAGGQVYVALSRCTTFEGITLNTPLRRQDIRTDPEVQNFMASRGKLQSPKPAPTGEAVNISVIENAIRDRALLDIVYVKSDGETTARSVYPRELGPKQNKGVAFLGMKAFCTLSNQELMFSVERIIGIKRVA